MDPVIERHLRPSTDVRAPEQQLSAVVQLAATALAIHMATAALAPARIPGQPSRSLQVPRLDRANELTLYPASFEDRVAKAAFVALDVEAVAAKVRRIIDNEDVVGTTYSSVQPHTTREGGRERKFWSMDIVIPKESYSDELADKLDDILGRKMDIEEIDTLLTWIVSE